jgi:serine protein kinase
MDPSAAARRGEPIKEEEGFPPSWPAACSPEPPDPWEDVRMSHGREIITLVAQRQDLGQFRRKNWLGTFEEYLDLVRQKPEISRNAFERVYDMIMAAGTTVYEETRGIRRTHYKFFDDPDNEGRDAVFGLDEPLESLVNALKSAAKGYGIEKRVLLLHGPVGSSKSTIARLLKRGLERYSGTDAGAVYTLGWMNEDTGDVNWCPMHEEPLHAIPERFREDVLSHLNSTDREDDRRIRIVGELCPYCRFMYTERLKKYHGDWTMVVRDIRVKRVVLSEQDRLGIGTFQPKDEKNQDSTELTGDINYRKIAEYGSDSDPRAFNFDGEFNVANRGIIEFIEVLKLDVAFLYDLLGASQEHKVKPKKFAQTDIDTRSSRRSSPRRTSTKSLSGTPTNPNIAGSKTTSSWRPSATAPSRSTCRMSRGCRTKSRFTRRITTPRR